MTVMFYLLLNNIWIILCPFFFVFFFFTVLFYLIKSNIIVQLSNANWTDYVSFASDVLNKTKSDVIFVTLIKMSVF